jgi:Zn-dependent protease
MNPGNTGWWMADVLAISPEHLFSWVIWVVLSICLHELGHGWAAIWEGDNTPRELGHMTFDPLVHMGKFSLIMFAVIGIAWGAMPVSPQRFRHRYGDAIVSFAGPAVNIVLALFCILAAGLWIAFVPEFVPNRLESIVRTFFVTGAMLNIALLILNLLPIPPLDGSTILSDFVPAYRRFLSHPNAPIVGLIVLLLLFFRGGGVIFGTAANASWSGINRVVTLLNPEKIWIPGMSSEELDQLMERARQEMQSEGSAADPAEPPVD